MFDALICTTKVQSLKQLPNVQYNSSNIVAGLKMRALFSLILIILPDMYNV